MREGSAQAKGRCRRRSDEFDHSPNPRSAENSSSGARHTGQPTNRSCGFSAALMSLNIQRLLLEKSKKIPGSRLSDRPFRKINQKLDQ
jgi:hypothetical protein